MSDVKTVAVVTSSVDLVLLRRLRRMQGFGGLLVAVCFFLPAVDSCKKPLYPYRMVNKAIMSAADGHFMDRPEQVVELAFAFAICCACYLSGLIIAVIGMMRVREGALESLRLHKVLLSCVIAWLIGGVFLFGGEALRSGLGECAAWTTLAILTVGYCLFLLRCEAWSILARWIASLWIIAWSVFWIVFESGRYGMYLTLAGGCIIAVSCTLEAKHRSRLTWGRLVPALVLARLNLADDGLPRCAGCGYLLIGLESARCPECGRAFATVSVAMTN